MRTTASVVLTRPAGQNDFLVRCVESAGHRAIVMPWLQVQTVWTAAERQAWWAQAYRISTIVFVSVAAVWAVCPEKKSAIHWPNGVWAVATGPGTAQALRSMGVPDALIRAPQRQLDSEGIWKECADCFPKNARVTILRGQSGRSWLGDQATEAGCFVEYLAVYARTPCMEAADDLLTLWRNEGVNALVLTNSEAIRKVGQQLPSEFWEHVMVFIPHVRIEATAREIGAQSVVLTEGGDRGLCIALQQWFARLTA